MLQEDARKALKCFKETGNVFQLQYFSRMVGGCAIAYPDGRGLDGVKEDIEEFYKRNKDIVIPEIDGVRAAIEFLQNRF